jgi:hypothetical protein
MGCADRGARCSDGAADKEFFFSSLCLSSTCDGPGVRVPIFYVGAFPFSRIPAYGKSVPFSVPPLSCRALHAFGFVLRPRSCSPNIQIQTVSPPPHPLSNSLPENIVHGSSFEEDILALVAFTTARAAAACVCGVPSDSCASRPSR